MAANTVLRWISLVFYHVNHLDFLIVHSAERRKVSTHALGMFMRVQEDIIIIDLSPTQHSLALPLPTRAAK